MTDCQYCMLHCSMSVANGLYESGKKGRQFLSASGKLSLALHTLLSNRVTCEMLSIKAAAPDDFSNTEAE